MSTSCIYLCVLVQAPWVEFIPEWDLKAELNSSVMEWVQLAAYQKSLPFRPQPSQLKQSTGVYCVSSTVYVLYMCVLCLPLFQQLPVVLAVVSRPRQCPRQECPLSSSSAGLPFPHFLTMSSCLENSSSLR